jgi:hypothetical protein
MAANPDLDFPPNAFLIIQHSRLAVGHDLVGAFNNVSVYLTLVNKVRPGFYSLSVLLGAVNALYLITLL